MNRYIFLALVNIVINSSLNAQQTTPITIGNTIVLPSAALKEDRKINVTLPPDYNPTDTTLYPVIYIPDGGQEEDFIHIAGIVRFSTQAWVNRFPPAIVVGIENTNRRRDFTFAVSNLDFIEKEGFKRAQFPQPGGSAAYIQFLQKELQPYINKIYKTNGNNTIIGESLAGLLCTEILLRHSDLFSNYIIVSPSLWWGGQTLLAEAKQEPKPVNSTQINVYLGIPNKEEDLRMYEDAILLSEELKKKKQLHFVFDYLSEEQHATIFHLAVYNAFKKLFSQSK